VTIPDFSSFFVALEYLLTYKEAMTFRRRLPKALEDFRPRPHMTEYGDGLKLPGSISSSLYWLDLFIAADIEEGGGTLGDVQAARFVVAAGCIVVREGRKAGIIIAFLV
jgi:hypothetical protein